MAHFSASRPSATRIEKQSRPGPRSVARRSGKLCWNRAARRPDSTRIRRYLARLRRRDSVAVRRRASVGSQLGQRIRVLREALSFTQEELAKKASIGVSYL